MSLNATSSAERTHIGFFGVRNAGKSSVVNAVTGQELSVVSDTLGTTTDPVRKAMELLPAGPVVIIDTPGIDDEGALGELRVKKARQAMRQCDVAILVVDVVRGMQQADKDLVALFEDKKLPYIIAFNKADLMDETQKAAWQGKDNELLVSANLGEGIHELKEAIAKLANGTEKQKRLVSDLLKEGDVVVLVIPIDSSAPKLRLIMPQQMVIRDCLDANTIPICCQVGELAQTLEMLPKPPRVVITDPQAFGEVSKIVPEDVMLTSFSILMARYRGELTPFVEGAAALTTIKDGDKVLICESCSHHRQCEDIGTVKMPNWVRGFSGAEPEFHFVSGREFPDDVSDYKAVIHCGGCMSNDKEMQGRVAIAKACGVPIVNYGIAIAQMHGILKRSVMPFPAIAAMVD